MSTRWFALFDWWWFFCVCLPAAFTAFHAARANHRVEFICQNFIRFVVFFFFLLLCSFSMLASSLASFQLRQTGRGILLVCVDDFRMKRRQVHRPSTANVGCQTAPNLGWLTVTANRPLRNMARCKFCVESCIRFEHFQHYPAATASICSIFLGVVRACSYKALQNQCRASLSPFAGRWFEKKNEEIKSESTVSERKWINLSNSCDVCHCSNGRIAVNNCILNNCHRALHIWQLV